MAITPPPRRTRCQMCHRLAGGWITPSGDPYDPRVHYNSYIADTLRQVVGVWLCSLCATIPRGEVVLWQTMQQVVREMRALKRLYLQARTADEDRFQRMFQHDLEVWEHDQQHDKEANDGGGGQPPRA